jgi:SAM-dependent methyltransferase
VNETQPAAGAAGDSFERHDLGTVTVSDDGLLLRSPGSGDFPVDVLFDDRRIASFWLRRDTESAGVGSKGGVLYRWPAPLHRFLDGTTELSLVDHVSGDELYRDEVALGSGGGRIRVEDAQGNPLGLDKSNRLSRLFTSRSAEHLEPLLDSIGTVVGALEEAGVHPFLAYGTLLGAVRQGDFIGHDSDADIGYVSEHDHPVDASLESFRLQRRLIRMGYDISRYSGLAFKVIVRESDGATRGLDVFGGFVREGTLYLMGEVGRPFRREWLEPRSEVTLAGRTFPAPHEPERLLEAMYGPGWRVPDPAYKFETPESTHRRLNGWFRGTRVKREAWDRTYSRPLEQAPLVEPSDFATWVLEQHGGVPERLVDIGCGRGVDDLWFARQGSRVVGLDYVVRGSAAVAELASAEEVDLEFRLMNLCELRSVLAGAARLAHEPGPKVVTVRNVAEATDPPSRERLWRACEMLLRGGGRLYVEVLIGRGDGEFARRNHLRTLRLPQVASELRERGARIVAREKHVVESPDAASGTGHRIGRLVVEWQS